MRKLLITLLFCITVSNFLADEKCSLVKEDFSLQLKQVKQALDEFFDDQKSFLELSLDEFVDRFKDKYKLTMPNITIKENPLSDIFYDSEKDTIGISPEASFNSISTLEWCLLHEVGHAQMPGALSYVNTAALLSGCTIPFVWGKHKKVPYKNTFTKIASKGLATVFSPILCFCIGRKLEERRADNFANKYADKEALLAAINFFESHQQSERKAIDEVYEMISTEYPICSKLAYGALYPLKFGDPIHPTTNSRIRKIKGALKTRFGVEV